jgi:hypothetical protein
MMAVRASARPNGLGEVFEIYLMTNPRPRRHHFEIVEGGSAPFEESVTLGIALIFDFNIAIEGRRTARLIGHHRMVDHEVDRHLRVNL